jgi:hypothetical protein
MSGLFDEALARIDRALEARPRTDGDALTEATRLLCVRRQEWGAADGRSERLEKLNGVISVVLASHYPMGGTPWGQLEAARGWLAELAASEDQQPLPKTVFTAPAPAHPREGGDPDSSTDVSGP